MRSAITMLVVSVLVLAAHGSPATAQATTVPVTAAAAGAATTAPTAGDTQSSRTVNRIVLALISLAALLLVLAIWLWRTTKPVPSHLDGLDAIGSRRWRRASDEGRASMLGPVHERRSELRDDDLIAVAEPDAPAAGSAEDEPSGESEAPDVVVAGVGEGARLAEDDAVADAAPVEVEGVDAAPVEIEGADAAPVEVEAPSTPLA